MGRTEILETVRRVAATTVRSNASRVDAEASWPQAGLRALQEAGLGGLVVPVDAGGLGGSLLDVALACEVLGRECGSTAICFGMHLVGSAVLAAKATPSQRAKYLEPIALGQHLTTLALSESGTGSHFYLPETKMTRTADGFVVRGTKSFVTNGGHADSYVVSTSPAETAAEAGEFSCAILDAHVAGTHWNEGWRGWGMRGNSAASVTFEDVRLPADALLGQPGDEIWYVFNVVTPYFLVAMAGTYLGLTAAAFDAVRAHLLERRHSHTGASLAESSVVQLRVGEMWAVLQRTRSLLYDACRMSDADALPALCSAKAEVAEAAEQVVSGAMTLAGGRGYAQGDLLQRLYRDIRAAHVMAPTTDILRVWTGRAVLGQPILGD